ncbi:MAG: DsbA family protein [Euryarchaeota archaeon]|nr:DsbA family protein [Euryarchaeota archaeon]
MATEKRAPSPRIVDVGARVTSRLPQGKLRIELLTDPWSVWCWGFEPVRRALALRHPELEFRFLLGGMFEEMPRPEQVGFDVDRFFAIVQRTTGMPIRADGPRKDPPRSTYPACIHVHTVRLLAPELEEAYLRALREAAYLDGLNISRDDVGADVAERVGVDRSEFLTLRTTNVPGDVFKQEVAALQAKSLHGYPTVLFTLDDRTHVVQGFQTLPAILGIAQSLTGKMHAPTPDPALPTIVPPGERVATREIAEVLGVSVETAYDACAVSEADGLLVREVHSTGVVWSRRDAKARPAPARRTPQPALIRPAP